MKRLLTVSVFVLSGRARVLRTAALTAAVAVAFCGAAGAAQASDATSPVSRSDISAVVVLIGANDYGFAESVSSRGPETR
jgi:hypothetical protein